MKLAHDKAKSTGVTEDEGYGVLAADVVGLDIGATNGEEEG